MQIVSQSWKNAHKQTLLNESYVEISLSITDPDALADVSSVDNGSIYLSNTPEIVSEIDTPVIPYTTLEQNQWLLDGTRKSIPESEYKDGGYVGDSISNEEGVFDTKIPTITIEFDSVHTKPIPGITITWGTAYNEFAEQFIVTAYNGDVVVAQKEIYSNTSVKSIVMLDISNYNRITIQVLKWCLPNHRVRIDEIFVGVKKVYTKVDLMGYSHEQSVDPISTSLPKNEIKFAVDNSDNSYNPYNPNSLTKYLTERQEITTRYGLKTSNNTIEWVKGGSFYLSEWYAKQNGISADFVARDILEFMSKEYKDDISDYYDESNLTFRQRSLYDLAITILNEANLPLNSDGSVKWVIDEERLRSIYTTAPIPTDTLANCLQMIANAGRCVLYPDRDGNLHIEPINNDPTDYEINSFNSYSKSEITLSKVVKQVNVNVYNYTLGDRGVEELKTTIVYEIADNGEIITVDNPLITTEEQANALGEWIGNYLKNRMTLKVTSRADVRLDALDIVSNENDYSTNNMRMTNVKFEFNGAFRGSGEGRVV